MTVRVSVTVSSVTPYTPSGPTVVVLSVRDWRGGRGRYAPPLHHYWTTRRDNISHFLYLGLGRDQLSGSGHTGSVIPPDRSPPRTRTPTGKSWADHCDITTRIGRDRSRYVLTGSVFVVVFSLVWLVLDESSRDPK